MTSCDSSSQHSSAAQSPSSPDAKNHLLPPPQGTQFSSAELAIVFAKRWALDHDYSLFICRSRGRGSMRTWNLRCSRGAAASPCGFEVSVRCRQEHGSYSWRLTLIRADHQNHEVRAGLDESKDVLSSQERAHIAHSFHCKPEALIEELNEMRRAEGKDEISNPKLVWNHRTRLRKKGPPDVLLRITKPIQDVAVHHRQGTGEGIFFAHHLALPWASRLTHFAAIHTIKYAIGKQHVVLMQITILLPTGAPCALAFAVIESENEPSLSWALTQARSSLAASNLAPSVVLEGDSPSLRHAIGHVWPSAYTLADGQEHATASSPRHFGVDALSKVPSVRLPQSRKWSLLQIVEEAAAWQKKQVEQEVREADRQKEERLRIMEGVEMVQSLLGLVSHKALRLVYDAAQEARARLAGARSLVLARAMARECTAGLPRRPIDALPSLGPLDTSACETWANQGLPCQHRLAIILDGNPKATLSIDDIPSFWHLADEEDQPRDQGEEEAARGPGAKRRRTSTCGSAKH